MAEHREWIVNLTAITEHEYRVMARTADEAEAEAESLFDSGDEGSVLSTEIESVYSATDVYSLEELDEEDIEFES